MTTTIAGTGEHRIYQCWTVIERSQEMPGQWTAHALDFDIVSYGDSPRGALMMVREAVQLAIVDDLSESLDPLARKAPPECWEPLTRIWKDGRRLADSAALAVEAGRVEEVQLAVLFALDFHRSTPSEDFPVPLSLLSRAAEDREQLDPAAFS